MSHETGGTGGGTSGGSSQHGYTLGLGSNSGGINCPIQPGGSSSNYYRLGLGQDGFSKINYAGHGTIGTGGGGGGYYGGTAYQSEGQYSDVGGGGGSGYIGGVSGGSTSNGVREGHGYARITTNFEWSFE